MIFEILWARILWVYVGTSLFVWTSIIGLILFALSLWYYIWWRLSDGWSNLISVAKIFSLCALGFTLIPYISDPILILITTYISDVRYSSLLATLILFVPVSIALWMIQPICTKVQLEDMKSAGKIIGRIGSIGTIGSIIWTICAWFFLIPYFWIYSLLIAMSVVCVSISLLLSGRILLFLNLALLLFVLLTYGVNKLHSESLKAAWITQIETSYSHLTIKDEQRNGVKVRNLYVDNVTHAGMSLESDELLYPYTRAYHLFEVFNPDAHDVLMLGWAAYSFPKSFLSRHGAKYLNVVEIDPGMTRVAKEYFNLEDSDRLRTIHSDARVYLNVSDKKYDAILWDAFGSYYSIPYQLTTRETVEKKYNLLSENGVVLLNIISSLSWNTSKFLHAQYKTYASIFPDVQIIPISHPDDESVVQNIMLIARKNPSTKIGEAKNLQEQEFLAQMRYLELDASTKVLSDDYAPVDFFTSYFTK